MSEISKLKRFVEVITELVDRGVDEQVVMAGARDAMKGLVAVDDWLPEAMARPHPQYYRQYLLNRDPVNRFSVVSFVWGPGQKTPVHDHTVWGVIGMLRGAELSTPYDAVAGGGLQQLPAVRLEPGDVECVGPSIGDVHQVRNAFDDRVSISIHCYGADIGSVRRHVFDTTSGTKKAFVSGYANS